MGLPLVGAHAVLTGVPEFEQSSNKVNNAVGGIQRNFVGLTAGAEGFGLTFGRAFSGVEAALLGVAAVGVKVGKSLLKDVFDAGPIANIEKVYYNMTKSFGVNSEKLMKDLRAASYGAVDDFELMQKANLSMIGAGKEFGKFFAESLPRLMKISRESAKAQGVDVEYAFNSVAVGIKRMSPMILDNLGFQISLTEATEAYAASIGKTSKELTKEEKQIAVLNAVLAQGDDLINSTGGHMDNVQTTWIAWGTAISNARKRFAIELLPIMQKFMDMLGTPSGDALTGKAVQLGKAITSVVLPAIDKMFMIIGALVNGPIALLITGISKIGFEGIKNLVDELSKVFTGEGMQPERLANIFKTAFGGILGEDIAGQLGRMIGQGLQTIQGAIAPVITFLQNAFASVSQLFADAGTAGAGFFADLTATAQKLWELLQPVIVGIADLIQKYIISSFQNAQRLVSDLQPTFQAVFDYVSGIISTFVNDVLPILIQVVGTVVAWIQEKWPEIQIVVQTVIDAVASVINWFATNILPFILDNFRSIVAWVQENWPLIKQTIETVLNAIWSVVQGVLNAIRQFWAEHGDTITRIVSTVWGAIKVIVTTVMGLIGGIIKTVMQVINGDWAGAWETIRLTAENLWNGIVAFLTGVFQSITSFLNEFLIKPVETAWNNFWGGVDKSVRSIWNGIVSFLQGVVNAAIGIINGLIEAFNTTIGKVTGEIPKIKEVAWTTQTELAKAGTAMQGSMTSVTDAVVGSVRTMQNYIANNGRTMANPMVEGFDAAKRKIIDSMNAIMQKIQDTISKATGLNIPMPQVPAPGGGTGGGNRGGGGGGSSGGGACFLSGTAILMANGRQMPIEHVTIGTQVKTYDLVHNEFCDRPVIAVMAHRVTKYFFLRMSDGTCLDVTGEHPFYAPNITRPVSHPQPGFISVRDMEIGDELMLYTEAGLQAVTVREKHEEHDSDVLVYNFHVQETHTYLANMMVVHNTKGLARGAILDRPTFVAGEAGTEVVAPLTDLTDMIRSALASLLASYAEVSGYATKPGNSYNYRGGDTYYQLTTQSVNRPGALAMEFSAMELSHL